MIITSNGTARIDIMIIEVEKEETSRSIKWDWSTGAELGSRSTVKGLAGMLFAGIAARDSVIAIE